MCLQSLLEGIVKRQHELNDDADRKLFACLSCLGASQGRLSASPSALQQVIVMRELPRSIISQHLGPNLVPPRRITIASCMS